MNGPPAVNCRDLSCGYRGRSVLAGASFIVQPGETVALIGPNGSGKSTLLNTLNGLVAPQAGDLEIFGEQIRRLTPRALARRIATVPQGEPTPFAFTVREVVTMGRLAGSLSLHDTSADRRAAEEAMARAECLHLAERPVTELSGGEKQRVLIARALAQDCPLLLLDEPTSHLDPPHQLMIAALAVDLGKAGKAVIAAVHDLNLAPLLADRVLILDKGSIVADGPTEHVLEGGSLEEVFKSKFDRVRTGSGRLLVVPRL